jgi:hypothetical protein
MIRKPQNTDALQDEGDQIVAGLAVATAAQYFPGDPDKVWAILDLFERGNLSGCYVDSVELEQLSTVEDVTNEQQLVGDFRAGVDGWLAYILDEQD